MLSKVNLSAGSTAKPSASCHFAVTNFSWLLDIACVNHNLHHMALCSDAGLIRNCGLLGSTRGGSLVSITSWPWTSQLIILHPFLGVFLSQESEVKDIPLPSLPCPIRTCWLTRIYLMLFIISLWQYLPKLKLPTAILTLSLSQHS